MSPKWVFVGGRRVPRARPDAQNIFMKRKGENQRMIYALPESANLYMSRPSLGSMVRTLAKTSKMRVFEA